MSEKKRRVILTGIGASPGVIDGTVKIVFDPFEASEKLKSNDVLVTSNTDPSWTICMRKAKAIVTNTGGILSHAAIVARELGIPCVVGTRDATEKLKSGMKVTVDGLKGVVYYEKE